MLRLDAHAGRWIEGAPMPTARNFARAVPLGDAIYVVGGDPDAGDSHGGSGSAVVERYEPACARRAAGVDEARSDPRGVTSPAESGSLP